MNSSGLAVASSSFALSTSATMSNVRAVAWRRDALSLDAGKGNRVGDLDDIANARQRVGVEECLGAQDQAAGSDAGALLGERVHGLALDVGGPPRLDLVIGDRAQLDRVTMGLALAPGDRACDHAKRHGVALGRRRPQEALFANGFDVLADRHVTLLLRDIAPAAPQRLVPAIRLERDVELSGLERCLCAVRRAETDYHAAVRVLDLDREGARGWGLETDLPLPVARVRLRELHFSHFSSHFSILKCIEMLRFVQRIQWDPCV